MTSPRNVTVLQQAAEWFAVLRDGSATETDRQHWHIWLNAHPDHAQAWKKVEAIGAPFVRLAETGATTTVLAAFAQARRNGPNIARRNALKLLGLGGTVLVAGWLGTRHDFWRDWVTTLAADNTTYRTGIGQTRFVTLADGTELWINTASRVDVTYSIALRRINLSAGEVLVQSAPATASLPRPLRIDTEHGQVTALGTRFSVRYAETYSTVAVFEGKVQVTPANGATPRVLNTGEQTRFNGDSVQIPQAADPAREAWSRGILLADNRRLDDFIQELARYQHGELSVAPQVAQLRLVGAYPLADIPRILAAVQSTLPVRVRQTGPQAWRVEAR